MANKDYKSQTQHTAYVFTLVYITSSSNVINNTYDNNLTIPNSYNLSSSNESTFILIFITPVTKQSSLKMSIYVVKQGFKT